MDRVKIHLLSQLHGEKSGYTCKCVCMCVYMCLSMCVCMNGCVYVYIYAYMHVCVYVCIHACMYVAVYMCMDVCVYIGMYVYLCLKMTKKNSTVETKLQSLNVKEVCGLQPAFAPPSEALCEISSREN